MISKFAEYQLFLYIQMDEWLTNKGLLTYPRANRIQMRIFFLLVVLLTVVLFTEGIKIEKALLYDRHTLEDTYNYGKQERCFQWDKISGKIDSLIAFEDEAKEFGVLSNYKNRRGIAPLSDSSRRDAYKAIEDKYGVKRDQSVPFYKGDNLSVPQRYGRDGALVSILRDSMGYLLVSPASFRGEWWVPSEYVERLGGADFRKLIFVDRTNQNVATMEYKDLATWQVRSMNPITTGLQRPPYKRETPPGVFVVKGKLEAMPFLRDGTIEAGGFAPWASRFSGGAYLHGVPVNYPDKVVLEYSGSLGTTPRSHMCVRSATSHAKFVYNWAPGWESLVIVFD